MCRRMMGLILDHLGVEALLVCDGGEAVAAWRPGRFDVLLLDIEMPRLSGLEVTRILRAKEALGAVTPIIIVSSAFRPERINECMDAGADLHLAKPVTASVLASALASISGKDAFTAA